MDATIKDHLAKIASQGEYGPLTWLAAITLREADRTTIVVPADHTRPADGLLRSVSAAALAEAAEYVAAGLAAEAEVYLYKTTKARGTERDRYAGSVYTEGRAVLISDFWGSIRPRLAAVREAGR